MMYINLIEFIWILMDNALYMYYICVNFFKQIKLLLDMDFSELGFVSIQIQNERTFQCKTM